MIAARPDAGSEEATDRPDAWWSPQVDRAARLVFFALVVVTAVTLRLLAEDQWFQIDEWGFLADRRLDRIGDLFRPFNQHWSTLPILVYRGLWRLVGLRHYWPYQLLAIASHLCVGCLLMVTMRRTGVHPWLATAAIGLFLLYGSGRDNIVNGFQIGFTGALALGLASLLLTDHGGPFDRRRDGAGMACGLTALMCSGIGVPMVLTLALATTVRRGLRTAVLLVGPLLAVYAVWFTLAGSTASVGEPTVRQILSYAKDLVLAPFGDLTQVPGLGWLLAAVAVAGLVLLATSAAWRTSTRLYAVPIALVGGLAILALSVAQGRAGIPGGPPAGSERYTYVAAAMLLPALALGLSEVARRARPALLLGVGLLLVGIPGNIDAFTTDPTYVLGGRELVLSVARLAGTSDEPAELQPLSIDAPYLTIGWLREGRRSGHIPDPPRSTPRAVEQRALLHMSLFNVDPDGERERGCEAVQTQPPITVEPGARLVVDGPKVAVFRLAEGKILSGATFFRRTGEDRLALHALGGPLVLKVDAADAPVSICR